MRNLLILSLVLLGACAQVAQEVLPIPAALKGAMQISDVAVEIRPEARAAVAALDEGAAEPMATLLPRLIADTARAYGLKAGRPVQLLIEIDALAAPDAGSALLGSADRLSGTVFIRDADGGATLGQLYVDVTRRSPGLIGLATRGGGVRERLAAQFAAQAIEALGGTPPT